MGSVTCLQVLDAVVSLHFYHVFCNRKNLSKSKFDCHQIKLFHKALNLSIKILIWLQWTKIKTVTKLKTLIPPLQKVKKKNVTDIS